MYDFTDRFSGSKLLAALIILVAVLLNDHANLNPLILALTALLSGSNQPPAQGLSESGSNNTNPNPTTTGNGGG